MRVQGAQVVEVTEHATVMGDVHSRFLERFTNGGGSEVGVTRLGAATGAGDVAAPGIALRVGALDHQQLRFSVDARAECEQHGSCSPAGAQRDLATRPLGERAPESPHERMCRQPIQLRRWDAHLHVLTV